MVELDGLARVADNTNVVKRAEGRVRRRKKRVVSKCDTSGVKRPWGGSVRQGSTGFLCPIHKNVLRVDRWEKKITKIEPREKAMRRGGAVTVGQFKKRINCRDGNIKKIETTESKSVNFE